jgi:hypothetical protein
MSVTYCIDPRCTASQRCWREANERYGNAPGENYGPRCIPAPPSVERTYEQGIADAVAQERAAVVAWLRKEAVSHRRDGFPIAAYTMQERADAIERGEHRREEGA